MTSAAGSRIGILLTCRKSGLWVEAMSNQVSNFEVMSHDTLIGPGAFGSKKYDAAHYGNCSTGQSPRKSPLSKS